MLYTYQLIQELLSLLLWCEIFKLHHNICKDNEKAGELQTHTVEIIYSSCWAITWTRIPLLLLNVNASGIGCQLAVNMDLVWQVFVSLPYKYGSCI